MKILIIEDEAELADSIVSYLEGNNAICTLVSTIHEAINKIQNLSYDCVLLDLSLPDGNGLDFLKELKKNNRDEGIIVISPLVGLRIVLNDTCTGFTSFWYL